MPFNQNLSILAGVPQTTLTTWRSQAQAAYAALASGSKTASASYAQGDGSRSVTYTQADIGKLEAWIQLLNRAINGGCHQRRPIRPYFT